MSDTCPTCGHPKATHSFVGCLHDGNDICDCDRDFPEARKTDATAEAEKREAMAKAVRGTDPEWDKAATDAVLTLAHTVDAWNTPQQFTPDDVWALLEERQVPPPREPRALGPVLQRLTRAGRLEHKGYAPSRRRHKSPVGIYQAGPEL